MKKKEQSTNMFVVSVKDYQNTAGNRDRDHESASDHQSDADADGDAELSE